jgi:hypothetical protein
MTGAWLGSTFRELATLQNNARGLAAALPQLGAADPSTVVLLARNFRALSFGGRQPRDLPHVLDLVQMR